MKISETCISPFFTGTQTPQTSSLGHLAAVRPGRAAQTKPIWFRYILCLFKTREILLMQTHHSYNSNITRNKAPTTILVPLKNKNPELGSKSITLYLHKTNQERGFKILLTKTPFPNPKVIENRQ